MGRKLLEKQARKFKLSLKRYEDRLEEVLPDFSFSKVEDLLAAVGYGKLSARAVLRKLEPEKTIKEVASGQESAFTRMVKRVLRKPDGEIRVKGHDDLLVFRARCCNPIRGEDIIGYITVGRGISIHSANCKNVENLLLNPERRIEVSWSAESEERRYAVRLEIYTEDRTGILAGITNAISNVGTNIVNAHADTVQGRYGFIQLTVEVADTAHLEKVMNVIKGVEGVRDVERPSDRAKEARA